MAPTCTYLNIPKSDTRCAYLHNPTTFLIRCNVYIRRRARLFYWFPGKNKHESRSIFHSISTVHDIVLKFNRVDRIKSTCDILLVLYCGCGCNNVGQILRLHPDFEDVVWWITVKSWDTCCLDTQSQTPIIIFRRKHHIYIFQHEVTFIFTESEKHRFAFAPCEWTLRFSLHRYKVPKFRTIQI